MKKNILIGGKAGQGINQVAQIISSALVKAGFYVFEYRDYPSLIRGGHNFNIITFSDELVASSGEDIDVLIAFDENTYTVHKSKLRKDALIATDETALKQKIKCVFIDATDFPKVENMAFVGFLGKALGLDEEFLLQEIKERFGKKKLYELDKKALRHFYSKDYGSAIKLTTSKVKGEILSGSQAVAQGAMDAGMEVYFAYPMTPATNVGAILAQKQGVHKFFAAENEISVINMSLGASFAGRRVMCGTSGGGFDLMTEGISLAGMVELPIVVHLGQRTGPSTGVPTYTAQSDLNVALYGGHGDFNRIVIAPGDPEESYRATLEAFFLSEKCCVPVILLTDKHLLESNFTVTHKKYSLNIPSRNESPGKGVFKRNSYEHDLDGNTTEGAADIIAAVERRNQKIPLIKKEVEKLRTHEFYGKGKNLLIGYGSTKGAILDALPELDGFCYCHLIYLKPFPEEIGQYLQKAEQVFVVDNTATGQLADYLSQNLAIKIPAKNRLLQYDGRPFTPQRIINQLDQILKT